MSQENVELVREVYEAWNRDDFDAWLSCQDPAIEWHTGFAPIGGVYRGVEGMREFWTALRTELENLQVELQEIREVGDDRVVVLAEIRWRGPASEIELQGPLALVITIRNGKIVRSVDYLSHQEALEAVGLRQ
jgi:uncharacterized protein